jgi:hypothetical protein
LTTTTSESKTNETPKRSMSDPLLVFIQWYEESRESGMGRRQSINRAIGIMSLDDEAVDSLIDGRTCEGGAAPYIDIVCGKADHSVAAFQIGEHYYCSCCGGLTRLSGVESRRAR